MKVGTFAKNTINAGMTKQAVYELVRLGSHYEKYDFSVFPSTISFLSTIRGVLKNYRSNQNFPEINDSEVDVVARKPPDENYYFWWSTLNFKIATILFIFLFVRSSESNLIIRLPYKELPPPALPLVDELVPKNKRPPSETRSSRYSWVYGGISPKGYGRWPPKG